jgi:hypothetical protein
VPATAAVVDSNPVPIIVVLTVMNIVVVVETGANALECVTVSWTEEVVEAVALNVSASATLPRGKRTGADCFSFAAVAIVGAEVSALVIAVSAWGAALVSR